MGLDRVDSINIVRGAAHAAIVLAASDAPDKVKNTADYECSGTDDDVDIQAAIAALPTNGGQILLSPGTFTYGDSLVAKANVRVTGASNGGTTYKMAGGNTNKDAIVDEELAAEALFFSLEYINFDGNKANNTAGSGIVFSNIVTGEPTEGAQWDVRIRECFFRNFSEWGMSFNFFWGYRLDNVVVEFCETGGIFIDDLGDGTGVLNQLKVIDNEGYALQVDSCSGLKIIGGTYKQGTGGTDFSSVRLADASAAQLIGVTITQGIENKHGLQITSGTNIRILGGRIEGNAADDWGLDIQPAADNFRAIGVQLDSLTRNLAQDSQLIGCTGVGAETSGVTKTITKVMDHASITDNGDATGYFEFDEDIPAGAKVLSVSRDITEAFKDTVGNNSSVGVMLGDGADHDRWDKTASTGDDLWNSTTDAVWDFSDFQGTVVTAAAKTPRITFTTDSDMTDLISGAGAQGSMTVKITYRTL